MVKTVACTTPVIDPAGSKFTGQHLLKMFAKSHVPKSRNNLLY